MNIAFSIQAARAGNALNAALFRLSQRTAMINSNASLTLKLMRASM
jgi:hypothetical protein